MKKIDEIQGNIVAQNADISIFRVLVPSKQGLHKKCHKICCRCDFSVETETKHIRGPLT